VVSLDPASFFVVFFCFFVFLPFCLFYCVPNFLRSLADLCHVFLSLVELKFAEVISEALTVPLDTPVSNIGQLAQAEKVTRLGGRLDLQGKCNDGRLR